MNSLVLPISGQNEFEWRFFTSLEEFSTNVTIIRGNKWKNRRDFTMERMQSHVWCPWFWSDLFVQRFSYFLLNYRCKITNNVLVFPPIVVLVLSFFLSTHGAFLDIILQYLIDLLYFMTSLLRLQEILGMNEVHRIQMVYIVYYKSFDLLAWEERFC